MGYVHEIYQDNEMNLFPDVCPSVRPIVQILDTFLGTLSCLILQMCNIGLVPHTSHQMLLIKRAYILVTVILKRSPLIKLVTTQLSYKT